MREIRFRVWDIKEKIMIYDKELSDMPYGILFLNISDKQPWELMLWTGKRDINDEKVWEGDIIYNPVCGGKHPVKWMNMYEGVGLGIDCSSPIKLELCEVIGNIYEHPELLEVSK